MSDEEPVDEDLFGIGMPHCPRCLVLMDLTESKSGLWRCPECGLFRL
ncbi:MAG: hypothetical protein ACQEWM_12235 [Actinomycetota bacterium]